MSKKQITHVRLDEKIYKTITAVAVETGESVSGLIRDAINIYIEIYEKKKESGKIKFFIQSDKDKNQCEVLMPWLR